MDTTKKQNKIVGQEADFGPLGKFLAGGTDKPRRRSPFSVYQSKHFEARVSAEYKIRWDKENEVYKAYTQEEILQRNIRKPECVRTMTNTSVEFWNNETVAFKAGVQKEADTLYDEALAQYELGLTVAKTPLDYHK